MKHSPFMHVAGALIVLAILGALYAVGFSEINRLQQEAQSITASMLAITQAKERASETRGAYETLEEDELRMQAHHVRTNDIVSYLEELERGGATQGSDIAVVSVGDPVRGEVQIALSIVGSFDAVMRTVTSIEYGSYGSATRSLALEYAGEGVWSASLSVSVMTDAPL